MASDQSWFMWLMQSKNMSPAIILVIVFALRSALIAGGSNEATDGRPTDRSSSLSSHRFAGPN
jgi:hypothetical protein